MYHFSAVVDFSSENYSGSLDTGTPGTIRYIYSEDFMYYTLLQNKGVKGATPSPPSPTWISFDAVDEFKRSFNEIELLRVWEL